MEAMMRTRILGALALTFGIWGMLHQARKVQAENRSTDQEASKKLAAFNQEFTGACEKMDHRATAALWTDDGADLLPAMKPMIGKAKISEWLDGLSVQLTGAKMLYCTVDWKDVQIHG